MKWLSDAENILVGESYKNRIQPEVVKNNLQSDEFDTVQYVIDNQGNMSITCYEQTGLGAMITEWIYNDRQELVQTSRRLTDGY